MTTKFISENKDYWLVVDEEANNCKFGDTSYNKKNGVHTFTSASYFGTRKIIGYYPKHKDAPELEGVPLMVEMPMVEDVERLASIASKSEGYNGMEEDGGCAAFENGFIEGYKAAQSEKKFSEEDMINACKFGFDKRDKLKESEHIEFDQQDRSESKVFIQSLTTTKEQCPINFKVEMFDNSETGNNLVEWKEPKIINGRLQGEWIFKKD